MSGQPGHPFHQKSGEPKGSDPLAGLFQNQHTRPPCMTLVAWDPLRASASPDSKLRIPRPHPHRLCLPHVHLGSTLHLVLLPLPVSIHAWRLFAWARVSRISGIRNSQANGESCVGRFPDLRQRSSQPHRTTASRLSAHNHQRHGMIGWPVMQSKTDKPPDSLRRCLEEHA
jgi:hypothetical protein